MTCGARRAISSCACVGGTETRHNVVVAFEQRVDVGDGAEEFAPCSVSKARAPRCECAREFGGAGGDAFVFGLRGG